MTEWVLIIWVTVAGSCDNSAYCSSSITEIKELGAYSTKAICTGAAHEVVLEQIGAKRGAVTAVCVPRER